MMNSDPLPQNPYLLLTPGPLSTSQSVKVQMLRDWCTWDQDYNRIVQGIRQKLERLASAKDSFTSVLMQGSGTFAVEACLGTMLPATGKLLVLANGVYGQRMGQMARRLNLSHQVLDAGETSQHDPAQVRQALEEDPALSHVALVHCETTTGMLNHIYEIGAVVREAGRVFMVDAMSSFGGIPLDMAKVPADFLVSSANKCIQGVPGFGFILARRREMEKLKGRARSLSLDMYDQWREMEAKGGKWRFTSPTHTVRAFAQAMKELDEEGGPGARYARYHENQRVLVKGMRELGFVTLLPDELHSPIITSFHNPDHPEFDFRRFYDLLKKKGFVIYPGSVTSADTFRIGSIGQVFKEDVERLLDAVADSRYWA